MTQYLNDYRVPEVGETINMPTIPGGTGVISTVLMPQSFGYFTVGALVEDGKTWVVDTMYDTETNVWNSRTHNMEIYPDLDGWKKDM